jgi:hypothetical protein
MSTVAEIEEALEHLPANELLRLREWFLSRPIATPSVRPRTGAELAKLWPTRSHLRPADADVFAAELNGGRKSPPQPSVWE